MASVLVATGIKVERMLRQGADETCSLGGAVVWLPPWPRSRYFASRLVSMSVGDQQKAWWL